MTRLISHLLILLVLFTHSTVAMDVRVCQDSKQTHQQNISVNSSQNSSEFEQNFCLDAGGHCSHKHSHTVGLVSFNTFTDVLKQQIVVASLVTSVLIHSQNPPFRPPKT